MLAMTTPTSLALESPIEYPDSDGQPMSDNTLQFRWIVTIQGNLDAQYNDDQNVFVAGDLLWYPVQGAPAIRTAPDILVAFGRPKGYRGSYQQWREGGVAPQVVFEIRSPGNRPEELAQKFAFYDRYGVEEYYLYDPDQGELSGWIRQGGSLRPISVLHGWVSPRLGIRFDLSGDELVIYHPDGQRFLTFVELTQQQVEAQRRAEEERRSREQAERVAEQVRGEKEAAQGRAEQEQRLREVMERRAEQEQHARVEAQRRAEQEQHAREEAQRRAERLAERLRALGFDPEE
jgi:Uma2 family endonuclease